MGTALNPGSIIMKGKRASNFTIVALWYLTATILLVSSAMAQEAPAEPGGGFVDPEGIPVRPPTPDIDPVYRGPSIDTLATIRKRGVLRVGVSVSEPMVMHDTKGELVGCSIDIGHQLAEDLGVAVEFVESSWSQIIPDLLDRRFDVIISGLWVTPERALVVNYSDATSTLGVYLVAGKPLPTDMKTQADFNRPDVRIAVYAGTIQERVASRLFPQATLLKVEGDDTELTLVLEGKAHAVLVPTFAPQVIVRSAPDKLFLPLDAPLQTTVTAMAVRKGDPDFLNYLNSWLTVQRDDGWLGDRINYWSETTDWLK